MQDLLRLDVPSRWPYVAKLGANCRWASYSKHFPAEAASLITTFNLFWSKCTFCDPGDLFWAIWRHVGEKKRSEFHCFDILDPFLVRTSIDTFCLKRQFLKLGYFLPPLVLGGEGSRVNKWIRESWDVMTRLTHKWTRHIRLHRLKGRWIWLAVMLLSSKRLYSVDPLLAQHCTQLLSD